MFEATNVPLDDNLKLALAPAGQQAWDELKPQGSIDFTAHVTRQPNETRAERGGGAAARVGPVSIEPRLIPPFGRDRGHRDVQTRPGGLARRHRPPRSLGLLESNRAHGKLPPMAAGSAACRKSMSIGLTTDRELLAALPPAVQAMVEKLQPSGTIGLSQRQLQFRKSRRRRQGIAADVGRELGVPAGGNSRSRAAAGYHGRYSAGRAERRANRVSAPASWHSIRCCGKTCN